MSRLNRWSLVAGVLTLAALIFSLFKSLDAESATSPVYTVTWTAPTQYQDQTLIKAPITYQLYVGAMGAEVKWGNPVTSPPYILSPTPAPGVTCVQVTATVSGVESVRSPEACATVAAPVPLAPSSVKATVM